MKQNKLTNADIKQLVKRFKELIDQDVVGITSNDAIETVYAWLVDIGQIELALKFNNEADSYSLSPKIQKAISRYNGWED